MSLNAGIIAISSSNSSLFRGELENDLILCNSIPANIWLGSSSNAPNFVQIGSNVTTMSNLNVSGLTSMSNLSVQRNVSCATLSNTGGATFGSNVTLSNLIVTGTVTGISTGSSGGTSLSHRISANSSNWGVATSGGGGNTYTITGQVNMQVGVWGAFNLNPNNNTGTTITFPSPYATPPLIFVTAYNSASAPGILATPSSITTTSFYLSILNTSASTLYFTVNWMSIGQ